MANFSLRRLCEHLLLGLIIVLPFEYYFQKGEPLLTSLKLMLVVFLGCWMGMRGYEWLRLKNPIRLAARRISAALLLFVASQILAALLAPEFQTNAAKAAVKAALGALLVFAAADLISGAQRPLFRHLLASLAITGAAVALIGLGQLAGLESFDQLAGIFQSQRYFTGSRWRLSSTMEYPNTAASFIAASFFASLALIVANQNRGPRRYSWMLLITAQGLALLVTYSRGALGSAILALAIAAGVFKGFVSGRSWRWVAGASLILFLAGLPILFFRPEMTGLPGKRTARYGLAASEEIRYLHPNKEYQDTLMVRNESTLPWLREGFGVGYRWSNLISGEGTTLREGATFGDDVVVGHEQVLEVTFRTPAETGEYFLVWFIFRRDPVLQEVERSFSPAVVCVIHDPDRKPPTLSKDTARYLKMVQEERRGLTMNSVPSRRELWRAALQMWRSSPVFGIGPDNFRLAKWKHMDIPNGDETVLAHNLYLEILAGSGILGLSSLLWLLWEAGRILVQRLRATRSREELAAQLFLTSFFLAFLIHGLVDYFLKFTPTFVLFWIVLGSLCATSAHSKRTS